MQETLIIKGRNADVKKVKFSDVTPDKLRAEATGIAWNPYK